MTVQADRRGSGAADRLEQYLRERAGDGAFYCKSRFVAESVDLSPSQVGTLLAQLQGATPGLEIEQWSSTSATTWRVAPADD